MKKLTILALALMATSADMAQSQPVDYVSTLVGTQSTFQLSTGNTYPTTAMPWGMNFWTPQTGKMGDGWTYGYQANKIRGLKQTHQPSPWINDYGQFAIMATTGKPIFDEEGRASWFSHKAETAKPYHYKVYLADYDITAELAPTERACLMRFTFPKTDSANVIVDAFDKGSYIRLLPDKRTIVGDTTKNSGGVPDNFKNYFVIVFDRDFNTARLADGKKLIATDKQELQADHAGAIVTFSCKRGEQVHARVASSFISEAQAMQNLKELGNSSFETLLHFGQWRHATLQSVQRKGVAWNDVYRHRLLGYVPQSLPFGKPCVPLHGARDARRTGEHLQGEWLFTRMGKPWTSQLHGG